jgi:hypothetical protein
MEYLKKMKKMKGDEEMSPMEKEAKMGVLSGMKKEAGNEMLDKLNGMKKVSVASDSEEGLKAGLDKAKQLMDQQEQSDMEMPEFSLEEINQMIDELLEKKKLLEGNQSMME